MISAKEHPKKFIEVFDKKMSYVEMGMEKEQYYFFMETQLLHIYGGI